uniref:PDZ domain-containing protein n=2 Tax=Hyaloperonospora TaxID=184462 RepID=M4BWL9_HYAAE
MVLHPSLRPDFMAAAMNELLTPLQTDFVYDVAVPKRPEGLGMSLRMNQGSLVVGGFIDFENNSESPSVAARIIAVDDVLVAINKKSITSWSFEKSISMLAHAASPVYLTFRRRQAVMLL